MLYPICGDFRTRCITILLINLLPETSSVGVGVGVPNFDVRDSAVMVAWASGVGDIIPLPEGVAASEPHATAISSNPAAARAAIVYFCINE